MSTQNPQNMQKLCNPGIGVKEPRKKAIPSVTEVIVIDGPASVSPILNRSFADKCIGV